MVAGPDVATDRALETLQSELADARAERDAAQARESALAEVLQAINASRGDLKPVFDLITDKAMKMCDADGADLLAIKDGFATSLAMRNPTPVQIDFWKKPFDLSQGANRLQHDPRTIYHIDMAETDVYKARMPLAVMAVEGAGMRTLVQVPLTGEGGLIGQFAIFRRAVRPFSDKQIALVESFAAQVALAIENARLLTEQREALEQQTATAEVLEVINASPGELVPVFDAMLEKAMRLCDSAFGVFGRFDGAMFEAVASRGVPPALMDAVRQIQSPPPNSGLGRLAAGEPVVQLADLADTEIYRAGFVGATALVDIAGARTAIFVALRKDGALLGAFVMYRREVRNFTDKQVALLQNFAAQAVIAMENARLLTEQREALEQQTATADILRVISQSPTDIGPVMAAVAKAAVRFCGAEDAHVFLREGEEVVSSAHEGPLSAHPFGYRDALDVSTARAQSIIEARVTHIADTEALDPGEYPMTRANAVVHGFRSQLNAPMLRDGSAIGCICLRRRDPGAFTPRQIRLLETFAAQAVIAIENVRLFTELNESLDQQTATAEVLRVISQSPTEVQPVLEAVAAAAQRFCGATDVSIALRDGAEMYYATHVGPFPATVERTALDPGRASGRAILEGRTIHLNDIQSLDPVQFAGARRLSAQVGFQSSIAAPMMREGAAIGCVLLRKPEPAPFTARQIELLETFAAQAVIAIENARLFTELKESLEQQTATTEILQAINGSPGDVQPVFEAIVDKAMTLCDAAFGMFNTFDGQRFHTAATRGVPEAYARYRLASPPDYGPDTAPARLIAGEDHVHVADLADSDAYRRGDPNRRSIVDLGGARTILNVALRKEGTLLGMIAIYRQEVSPFTDQQIGLIQGFAAQAVIAMENARLLGELRQRTDDLQESLEYQTATSELLEVISRSTADVQPVLDTLLASACRLCSVQMGGVTVRRDDVLRYVATLGMSAEYDKFLRETPHLIDRSTAAGRATFDKAIAYIPDVEADPDYKMAQTTTLGKFRSLLGVPLLREGEAVGAITLGRIDNEPFTERQIGLVKTFADQAVIAIENARLLGELRESLDQQTATAEILRVINSSPGNLTPVFQAILEKGHSTCGADMGSLFAWDGTHVRALATLGYDAEIDKILRQPHRPIPAMVDLMSGQRFFHRVYEQDRANEGPHEFGPRFLAGSRIRTNLIIPLRKDDTVLGFISANRREVRPYSDKEIALLESFAAQAVIAMENARLLTELRQRTDDLTESLEYQTATSEVLEVIGRSTSDIQPVLDTMLASACRLCGVEAGGVTVRRGDAMFYVATLGLTPSFDKFLRETAQPIDRRSAAGRAAFEKDVVHIPDLEADPEYALPQAATLGRLRSLLCVPLLREGEAVGTITLARTRVEPFTERQVALIRTFADQAVIAMENARLLSELTRREEELRVTFDHMGDGVVMFDAALRLASWNRNFQELLDIPDSFLAGRPGLQDYVRLLVQRGEVGDGDADNEIARYSERASQQWSAERTRPDGRVIEVRNNPVPGGGAVLIYSDITERKKAEAEIAAARDAAEAALEQQTATADILKVIASSPTNVQPVLEAVAKAAVRFCGATDAVIHLREGSEVVSAAHEGPLGTALGRRTALDGGTAFSTAILERRTIQLTDIDALDAAKYGETRARAAEFRFRAVIAAPMLREDTAVGAISLRRIEPGAFTDQQIELLETFAAQAVIAIENVRLFTELRDSLERLKAAQANLVQSEKMATLGQLTAGIAHEIKNPLNFVNNFASLSVELLDELKEVAGPALETLDGERRAEVDETMSLLISNLGKITEHGKRADGIVKSMLSHSRGGSGEWQASDINALVEEALNLAYHGARAQDKEFNVTLERDFEKTSKPIEVVPQDVTRVFLNLFGNGFYAANRRRLAGKEARFRPTLKVSTREFGEAVEVRVRDNGTGIPPDVREKLFQPFFTTKPTGEGTGLGLSISYDIVTQQHGGTIEFVSEVGQYTEFTVRLPRRRHVALTADGR